VDRLNCSWSFAFLMMGLFYTAILAPLWQTFVSSFKVYHLSTIQASEDVDSVGYDSDGSERSIESFGIQVISCILFFFYRSIATFVLFIVLFCCTAVHCFCIFYPRSLIFQLFELWTTIVGNSLLAKVCLFTSDYTFSAFFGNNFFCYHTRSLQEALKSWRTTLYPFNR
jgi:hypothetical protein